MEVNKAVIRFKDGTLMKGKINDFFPNKAQFHLELQTGELVEIDIEQLKSIFFVKDYEGDKARKDIYNDAIHGGGRKIQVKFLDGEVLTGYSQGYSPKRSGFFVIPADRQGNNERIFVINSATENITFLKW